MRANCVRSTDRENVSILACISAAGEALPPMYIFAGKKKKTCWFNDGVPGLAIAMTDSSYIQGHIFMAWVKWFIKLVGYRGPQLIILDGHFSHLSPVVLHYAKANGVDIFTLPAHSSGFLQPCDQQPFSSFKRLTEKAIHEYPNVHNGQLPTRDNLVQLTRDPWLAAMTPTNICSGFKRCGIWPLSLEVMLEGCIGDVSVDSSTPMLELALKNICVTERMTSKWLTAEFDLDAMKIVYANVDRLLGTTVDASSCRKTKGSFLPEGLTKNLPSGGYLVTSEESLRVMDMQQAAKDIKAEQAAKKKAERLRKKALKLTQSLMTPSMPKKQTVVIV
jgi:hypothetical protein